MHVLVAEGRLDRDYIGRATLGFERLVEHLPAYSPDAVAASVGLPAETIVRFARRYGAGPRSFIRIGIGLSRHDNGGMTCRTLALEGLAREDRFTVVHEQVLTDTAHYADLVLPATTSMEHEDLYRSYGQFTLQLALPVLPPQGEALSNWEVCARLAKALGVAEAHYATSVDALIREFLSRGAATARTISYEQLRRDGWARLDLPRPYMPFAHGAPTPSGRVEFYSETMARQRLPALPTYVPLTEGPERQDLLQRFPLQCIVPPNRFFLNSSFSQSELLRRRQKTPTVMLAVADAAARGIGDRKSVV